jgi:uncharacterized membrane protein
VLHLLDEADGQLSQQDIVHQTAWSSSTVSRRLTNIEKQGDIVQVQLGSGKVVFLPETATATDINATDENHADCG